MNRALSLKCIMSLGHVYMHVRGSTYIYHFVVPVNGWGADVWCVPRWVGAHAAQVSCVHEVMGSLCCVCLSCWGKRGVVSKGHQSLGQFQHWYDVWWPVEVDAGMHLGWWQCVKKGQGVS